MKFRGQTTAGVDDGGEAAHEIPHLPLSPSPESGGGT